MPKSSRGTSVLRRVAVFVVFLVLCAALGYDYLVARPAVDQMFSDIETSTTTNELISKDELSKIVGKEPSDNFMDGGRSVDVYHWTSGLIVKPHKLFVAYEQIDGTWRFSSVSKFAYETTGEDGPAETSP
ncbi:MAG: hypothetical protein AAF802_04885 [Planctomycetota bacterium]